MPENYYCLDNFFQKLTAMESPRRNNDCYFYYYSTCTKGDSCTFRHEPSALGCETTCSFWKEGKCFNVQCNFRHMELRKNRKVIPCYWETQPGGCLKPHCPFLHQNPKHLSHSESQGEASDIKTQELNKQSAIQKTDSCAKNASQTNEKSFGNPVVDPLVVNFEEESDNESAPTQSPVKTSRSVKVKTLEEIRLEKVQAESAAYYSYPETVVPENTDDLRDRIVRRINMKQDDKRKDFNILSLKEIRRKRKLPFDVQTEEDAKGAVKRNKVALNKPKKDISEVKVKTLDEIRAERALRVAAEFVMVSSSNEIRHFCNVSPNTQSSEESEVSSTSKTEERKNTTGTDEKDGEKVAKVQPIKRLKRSRSLDKVHKQEKMMKLDEECAEKNGNVEVNDKEDSCDNLLSELGVESKVDNDLIKESESQDLSYQLEDDNVPVLLSKSMLSDTSKLDEVLLLDEEDLDEPDIKAEEDILKNIDDLLND